MKKNKFLYLFIISVIILIPLIISDDILSGSVGFNLNVKGGMLCNRSATLIWINYSDPAHPILRNATGSDGNCYFPEGMDMEGNSITECCPIGTACTNITSIVDTFEAWDGLNIKIHKCVVTSKNFCNDYTNEADCISGAGHPEIANFTVYHSIVVNNSNGTLCGRSRDFRKIVSGVDSVCQNETRCKCIWNSAKSKCDVYQNITTPCWGSSDPPIITDNSGCNWTNINLENHCLDGGGYILSEWQGVPFGLNPPANCNNEVIQNRVDCESIILMNFFDGNSFFICLLLITGIYLIIIFNKNQNEK